ncbi:MAG TPA: benzoyl-CoA 2,3-epoxidase subunit BoxA [Casimicrobiaceae bacterium]|nr:benzoyl-CoA 2,3-epoxidase subunit BoxA [Casimicrobiaceae bacterium]
MNAVVASDLLKQHLIDPEICIRCNTCEETCPIDAITHDSRNYVVRPEVCNGCMACIAPCPTGAIDNWRLVPKNAAYDVEQQLSWDTLPAVSAPAGEFDHGVPEEVVRLTDEAHAALRNAVPPRSASTPVVNLYTPSRPATATVTGNFRLTSDEAQSDIRHIVLDFGTQAFPVLEGQSIGVIAPGTDAAGKPHYVRLYSVASPRDGERPGYNNCSLTVKRVTADHAGNAVHGVCSNFLCDLRKGDHVQIIGPYGESFLMPDDPAANLLMVCTGTGSAPMRAMTERRRRSHGMAGEGRLMLFFGARRPGELPYFGPLQKLPRDFIDVNLAFSRLPDQPKCYVQDLIVAREADVAGLLGDPRTHVYVCGLKGMEAGVLDALSRVCRSNDLNWEALLPTLRDEGRLHIETY